MIFKRVYQESFRAEIRTEGSASEAIEYPLLKPPRLSDALRGVVTHEVQLLAALSPPPRHRAPTRRVPPSPATAARRAADPGGAGASNPRRSQARDGYMRIIEKTSPKGPSAPRAGAPEDVRPNLEIETLGRAYPRDHVGALRKRRWGW